VQSGRDANKNSSARKQRRFRWCRAYDVNKKVSFSIWLGGLVAPLAGIVYQIEPKLLRRCMWPF
jgi:hypothetical protein